MNEDGDDSSNNTPKILLNSATVKLTEIPSSGVVIINPIKNPLIEKLKIEVRRKTQVPSKGSTNGNN